MSLDGSNDASAGKQAPTENGATGGLDPSGKPVSDSQVYMARQMMPDDANPWGDVHGGTIMKMVDEAAGSAAIRHARCRVATAAIDFMSFLHPVHVGDLLMLSASVNDVGRTSMEVGVRVEAENMLTGERHHTSSAYVVMVGLDDRGCPSLVPRVIAETPDQRRRMAAAKIRRSQRKVLERVLKASAEGMQSPPAVAVEVVAPPAE